MSGIFQKYPERLRNECGFTELDSASCPRPSGRQVLKVIWRFGKGSEIFREHSRLFDFLLKTCYACIVTCKLFT